MRQRIIAILATVGVVFGSGLAVATQASAGTCTVIAGIAKCGYASNHPFSQLNIRVTNGWPAGSAGSSTVGLAPGSGSPYRDTDGYYIPSGGCVGLTRGPVWIKITDLQSVQVKVTAC